MDVHLILEKREADYFCRMTGERDAKQALVKFISRVAGNDVRERRLARWQPDAALTQKILASAARLDSARDRKNKASGTSRHKRPSAR